MFLVVFLLLYGGMNSYVVLRLMSLWGLKRSVLTYLFIAIITLWFIPATALESAYGNTATRGFYLAAATWMGVVFLLCSLLLVYELVRFVMPVQKGTAGWIIIMLAGILTGYGAFNARRLMVNTIPISAPIQMKIVQLSDIHLGSTSRADLEDIIEKTNALAPDVVFITGDLLDNLNAKTQGAVLELNNLKMPAFFVTGNHEGYVGVDRVMGLLAKTSIKPLRNEAVEFNGIGIIGIDDSFNRKQLSQLLGNMDTDKYPFTILLYHRPEDLAAVTGKGIDLMLSGHTHNGQIFPFNFIVRIFYPYTRGLHQVGDTCLYVSVGTGNWGPPLRMGSRREITLFQLGPP
ncbi:MAG: metallophosphoesterase [Sedimentisphaerales bacterium]|nr:metallophosphoesterase [Sedimentisphaerales bacterium]